MKLKITILLTLITVVFLNACVANEDETKQKENRINLNSEGEFWTLSGYNLEITEDSLVMGDGELTYLTRDLETDYLSFKLIGIIDNEKVILHEIKIICTTGQNFNTINTGTAKAEIPKNKNNKVITLKDIDELHGLVEWNSADNQRLEDKFVLK